MKLSRIQNQGYSKPLCLETDLKHEQCSIVHSNLWTLTKAIKFTSVFNWLMHKFFELRTKFQLLLHCAGYGFSFKQNISASPFGQYRSSNLSNFADSYTPGTTLLIHKVACSGSHNTRSLQRNAKRHCRFTQLCMINSCNCCPYSTCHWHCYS